MHFWHPHLKLAIPIKQYTVWLMDGPLFPHQQVGSSAAGWLLAGPGLRQQLSASEPADMLRVTPYMSSSLNFIPISLIKMRSLNSPTCGFSQQLAGLFTSWVDLWFNFMDDITQLSPDGIIRDEELPTNIRNEAGSHSTSHFCTVIIFCFDFINLSRDTGCSFIAGSHLSNSNEIISSWSPYFPIFLLAFYIWHRES